MSCDVFHAHFHGQLKRLIEVCQSELEKTILLPNTLKNPNLQWNSVLKHSSLKLKFISTLETGNMYMSILRVTQVTVCCSLSTHSSHYCLALWDNLTHSAVPFRCFTIHTRQTAFSRNPGSINPLQKYFWFSIEKTSETWPRPAVCMECWWRTHSESRQLPSIYAGGQTEAACLSSAWQLMYCTAYHLLAPRTVCQIFFFHLNSLPSTSLQMQLHVQPKRTSPHQGKQDCILLHTCTIKKYVCSVNWWPNQQTI